MNEETYWQAQYIIGDIENARCRGDGIMPVFENILDVLLQLKRVGRDD